MGHINIDNERKKQLDAVLLPYNLMAIDYIFIDNYKFTKHTVYPIYNRLTDHDAQLLTITNYGAEHYLRGHQM
jgi:hypothetical protein